MKTSSLSRMLFLVGLALQSLPVGPAQSNGAPRVGHLREFERFTFNGNESFPAEKLWFALNSTFEYPEQSHPLAPRDAFLDAVGHDLRLGYQHSGFPDASADAEYDAKDDKVIVRIEEGPRFHCGPVQVIGAEANLVAPIVQALTVSNSDSSIAWQTFQFFDNAPENRNSNSVNSADAQSLWLPGQGAHFDAVSLSYLAGAVTNVLRERGFFTSRFHLETVRDSRTGSATLQVKFLDEGPRAIVNRIEVSGNNRNTREAILKYLGLKAGMEFDSRLSARINDELYHSARFLSNWVSAGEPDESGHVPLTIGVVESDEGPPLESALSRAEQTMLNAREWLAHVGQTREDAVFTAAGFPDPTSALELILSPRRGVAMLQSEQGSGNPLLHALFTSGEQIAFYAPERREKFTAHPSAAQLVTFATVETHAPDEKGTRVDLSVGSGMRSLDDASNAPPCAFTISLAPAAFVRLAHGTNSTCWFDGDTLIRSNSTGVLKLDARTGRLVEFTASSGEQKNVHLSLRFQPDAYAAALNATEQAGTDFKNNFRTNSPFVSAVAFFGSELAESKFAQPWLQQNLPAITCAEIPALLRKLEAGDFVWPFKLFEHSGNDSKDSSDAFQIPETPRPVPSDTVTACLASIAQGIFQVGDKTFPTGSWPWTIERDAAFLSRGQYQYVSADLTAACDSKETGPFGCLVAATVLKTINPPAAKAAASRGLERLSSDDFKRDCQLFLDPSKVSGRLAIALAGVLRNLDQRELDALAAPLPDASATFIRDCARRLQDAQGDQTLFTTISPAFDAWWDKGLKEELTGHLRQIAGD